MICTERQFLPEMPAIHFPYLRLPWPQNTDRPFPQGFPHAFSCEYPSSFAISMFPLHVLFFPEYFILSCTSATLGSHIFTFYSWNLSPPDSCLDGSCLCSACLLLPQPRCRCRYVLGCALCHVSGTQDCIVLVFVEHKDTELGAGIQ